MYVADYEREILRNLLRGKRMVNPFTDGNFLVNRREQSFHSMHDWRSTDELGPTGCCKAVSLGTICHV